MDVWRHNCAGTCARLPGGNSLFAFRDPCRLCKEVLSAPFRTDLNVYSLRLCTNEKLTGAESRDLTH